MIYVFVYVGEVGYELLNWQGVVRKFSRTISDDDKIVVCGRSGVESWYEFADQYIDISSVELYNNSVSDCHQCYYDVGDHRIRRGGIIDEMERGILEYIAHKISFEGDNRVIFSNHFYAGRGTIINGLQFGNGSIYGPPHRLPIEQNEYVKFPAGTHLKESIQDRLGFDLDEPFILCQTAWRDRVQRSKVIIDKSTIVKSLAKKVKVVLLGFSTGKATESESKFDHIDNCYNIHVSSFEEQSCLIHFAQKCVFFTEGDFRSHIYMPPMLGKDVYAIASADIYQLHSANESTLRFWNDNVFQFGGQIKPIVYETMNIEELYD
mgnify:CR=1 FL=1